MVVPAGAMLGITKVFSTTTPFQKSFLVLWTLSGCSFMVVAAGELVPAFLLQKLLQTEGPTTTQPH